ncbi:MAG: ABC transporter substrate-binding protein [Micromonosporaceae bacterium]|nr:ABC transporter substrate-binding protein [Micromonosporaceae bacterium]
MHLRRGYLRQARRLTTATTVLSVLLAVAGCSGSSLGTDHDRRSGTIRIGLLIPQSGVYKVYGPEIKDGFQLYLDTHGGKLGGHPVTVTVADEGDGKQTAVNSGKRLIQSEHVDVLVGTTTVDSLLGLQSMLAEAKIPFVGTGGRASTLKDISRIWHTSWLSREPGAAIADYLRTTVNGPVYAIGPDYQGGWDQVGGFTEAFTSAGGKLANDGGKTAWTPWPGTTNYLPYINKIAASDAKAVYAFYAGAAATAFVQQYAQSGLGSRIPLYGYGMLTDESLLEAEGTAADGIQTVLDYASDLDNDANRAFAAAYAKAHSGASPHLFHVTGWDAALLLDQAIAAASTGGATPTPEAINTAIGKVGQIDSPRGTWRWSSQHTPIQPWYLRKVAQDGRGRANVVVQTLTTLGN